MATPFLSGEAALIDAKFGPLAPAAVEGRIRSGARCVDQKNELRYKGMLGAGHADVGASLEQVEGQHCI